MQIAAELGYWEKKPAIILKASVPRSANRDKRYVIMMDHIWQYTEDHYEPLDSKMPKTFQAFMLAKCLDLFELFDLGYPSSRHMAELVFLIEASIDDVVHMLPYREPETKQVAEASMTIDGKTVETEVEL